MFKVLLFKEHSDGQIEPPDRYLVGNVERGVHFVPFVATTKKDLDEVLKGELAYCEEDSRFYYRTRGGTLLHTEAFVKP